MRRTRSHKLIYLMAALGFISNFFGSNIPEAAAATSSKQLLTQADFTYIGAFAITAQTRGDMQFSTGLTHRQVNGELHLFLSALGGDLYEVSVPGSLSMNAPFPQTRLVRDWGDVGGNKIYTASGTHAINGLYWDEVDSRLYWLYADPYTTIGDDPSFGYSTLNDATGASTPVGVWGLQGRGSKMADSCIIPIPPWFTDAYSVGKRLAAGCGGYRSIGTSGPASMGPALSAFSPPTTQPDRSYLGATILVGYPFTETAGTPYSIPDRVHRDTDYSSPPNDWVGWNPRNGIGYATAGDALSAGVWIDLPAKQGVIFFPTLANGYVRYGLPEAATIVADRGSHCWFVYDPADFVKVAQGQKQQWEIQPASTWSVQYPGLTYPLPGWRDGPSNTVIGATYDSTTRRLYVAVRFGDPEYSLYGVPLVYVYEVQSGSNIPDATPPAAPGVLRVR